MEPAIPPHAPADAAPAGGLAAGPFALMVDPAAVFDAIQKSERLRSLRRRVYRPLGQPSPSGRDNDLDDDLDDFGQPAPGSVV